MCCFIAFSSAAFVFLVFLLFVESFPFLLVNEKDLDQIFYSFLSFLSHNPPVWRIPGDKTARVEGLDLTNVQCTTLRCPISNLKNAMQQLESPMWYNTGHRSSDGFK